MFKSNRYIQTNIYLSLAPLHMSVSAPALHHRQLAKNRFAGNAPRSWLRFSASAADPATKRQNPDSQFNTTH